MPQSRKKSATLGDILSSVARVKAVNVVYFLLLIAVFLLGYLVARVQSLEKNAGNATTQGQGQQQEPAKTITANDVKNIAKEMRLNTKEFNSCLDDTTHQEKIDADLSEGTTAGATGTPTFYINGTQMVGALPYEKFKETIDAAINGTTGVVTVATGHLPALGRDSATVNVIEFSDLECPFCRSFFNETFPKIKKDYIDTGKIKYYFRHYPLNQLHPMANTFANAVECANDQGKFWEMHDRIFEAQN